MDECLFCPIAARETPAALVLADDRFVGFLDHRPVFKGHVLLVPRQHVVTLPELPAALRDPFVAYGQALATAMIEGLGAQGSFVALNRNVHDRGIRGIRISSPSRRRSRTGHRPRRRR